MRNETVSHESAEGIEIGPDRLMRLTAIACQFEGDDICRTADFEVRGYAPALDMCGRLLAPWGVARQSDPPGVQD